VHGQAIARVALVHAREQIVPEGLGQDGRGGNAGHQGVAANHGAHGHGRRKGPVPVDQHQIGSDQQGVQGMGHGFQGSLQDVHMVDFPGPGKT
jgi:hypothetical protein